jgi:hypothetical protein
MTVSKQGLLKHILSVGAVMAAKRTDLKEQWLAQLPMIAAMLATCQDDEFNPELAVSEALELIAECEERV